MADFFNDQMITVSASAVGAVLSVVLGLVFKNAVKRQAVEKGLEIAIPIAAKVVTEVSKHTQNTVDDKVALGLRALAGAAEEKGIELTDAHKAKAVAVFEALHAESKEQK
jgi:hypothetical protein